MYRKICYAKSTLQLSKLQLNKQFNFILEEKTTLSRQELVHAQLAVIKNSKSFYLYLGNQESFSLRIFLQKKDHQKKKREFAFLSEIEVN